VDGEVRQDGRTSQFIHDIPDIISYVTSFMTLLPGDVVLTGTPAGSGPIEGGQEVSVAVERLGTISNRVVTRDGRRNARRGRPGVAVDPAQPPARRALT